MSIDIFAVDLDPVLWAVYCELCEKYVTEPTEDGDIVDLLYEAHCEMHGVFVDEDIE